MVCAERVRVQRGGEHCRLGRVSMTVTGADGILLLAASVLTLAGISLTAWALRGDRSCGRLRCPKCWYDMAGSDEATRRRSDEGGAGDEPSGDSTSGLIARLGAVIGCRGLKPRQRVKATRQCPECGKHITREKHLRKTRRRWRWATVGCFMLMMALCGAAWPTLVRNYRWISLTPNDAMVWLLPLCSYEQRSWPEWRQQLVREMWSRDPGASSRRGRRTRFDGA
jgi:predicted RNA-binding Zn-ribbon protein involved in translation (DUF1610 family)